VSAMKTFFDAVAWMRARRAEIDEEDRSLSWEEKREKTRALFSELDQKTRAVADLEKTLTENNAKLAAGRERILELGFVDPAAREKANRLPFGP